MPVEDLRQSPMMSHLLDALDRGEDIGHYGRLVFVMVGRHFLSDDELVEQLKKDPDCDEQKARGLIKQVESRAYNPPKRERILEWMSQQDFPICQSPSDQTACNVYRTLDFPPEVYEKISSFYKNQPEVGPRQ
jgi:DNA primase large subunit